MNNEQRLPAVGVAGTMNSVKPIAIDKLLNHPANPNRMSRANFAKLVRNIKLTGRYEPLIVRPHPTQTGCYQIINGHHRRDALLRLGRAKADCIIWDVDDGQTDILLATLNRLSGADVPAKKSALFHRLTRSLDAAQLAKLLPNSAKQIQRLASLSKSKIQLQAIAADARCLAEPLVFFVDDSQKLIIERALCLAQKDSDKKTKAAKRAAALMKIAALFCQSENQSERTKVTFRDD